VSISRLITEVLDELVEADPRFCPECKHPLAVYGDDNGCLLCRHGVAKRLNKVLRRRPTPSRGGGCKGCGIRRDSRTPGCHTCTCRHLYRKKIAARSDTSLDGRRAA
jgi:hypothetical protein